MDLKELERAGVDQTTRLKLSEAIRIGSRGKFQSSLFFEGANGCCAWGAAALAAGYDHSEPLCQFLSREFPVPENVRLSIHGKNACRNVFPGCTFVGIADWLAAQGL